jgi:NTP pyrophosphatase (non-canonical NTP hydrolase)
MPEIDGRMVKCPSCGCTTLTEEVSDLNGSRAFKCSSCETVFHVHLDDAEVDIVLFDQYQKAAHATAMPVCGDFAYPALKLAGEAGEVAEKFGKLMRDHRVRNWEDIPEDKRRELVKELGDVMWYISEIATRLGVNLSAVAVGNIVKLQSRQERGQLHGDGDDR